MHDGYLLRKSVVRTALGGAALTRAMLAAVEAKGVTVSPPYAFKRVEVAPGEYSVRCRGVCVVCAGRGVQGARQPTPPCPRALPRQVTPLDLPGTTASYRAHAVAAVAADVKETLARVSDGEFDAGANAQMPTQSAELPDGTTVELGADRLNVPEALFSPSIMADYGLADLAGEASLPEAVRRCVAATDSDARKDMAAAIVLTGGGALLTGLRDRLEREVAGAMSTTAVPRVKVVSPANPVERRFSVWIGGSILASLGSFQQMWVSKAEYDEVGKGVIHRKAP